MRGFLLASVSSAALATAAWAGETPKAMQAMASAPPSWSGFYAGLDLGWIGNRASLDETGEILSTGYGTSMTSNGLIAGGHAGYNWQLQQFVLGVEADISGASGSGTVSFAIFVPPDTFSSRINWLSTFRGRLGVAFDEWLVYGTGGWGVASVHNTFNDVPEFGVLVDQTKTMSGFVWGGGVERMFGQHWRGRIEALAVDLGNNTVHTLVPGNPPIGYTTRFANKAAIVRGGVSFAW